MTDDKPDTPSAEVAAMAEPWALVTSLMGGTVAMRKAGATYLWKNQVESVEAFNARLARSTLYEAFKRAVVSMAARPFSEAVKFGEDMPEPVRELCDDIDLEGRDLQAFGHQSFEVAMAYGLSHILVEYPTVTGVQTLAEQRAIGARPYWVHIDPKNVLGWRSERIRGVQTLTQLRLKECVTEPAGKWGEQQVEQIRVFDRIVTRDAVGQIATDTTIWTTYRKSEKGDEWEEHDSGPVSIGVIPLATVYTKRTGWMTAEPPLMGLAHLNVEHWNSGSVQSNLLRFARTPILYGAGWAEGTTITIGASAAVTNDDPAAKLAYVEHSGAAIGAGQESIDKLEQRMSVMGMELLVSKPGTKTATEANIDTDESTSALQAMVNNLEDSLGQALQFSAMWLGLEEGGSIELDGDFTSMDPLDLPALVQAKVAGGIISGETVFRSMQTRGLVDEEIEWEDEQARIAAETTAMVETEGKKVEATTMAAAKAAPAEKVAESAKQSATPAEAPDFKPLADSIAKLVAALDKQQATPPPEPQPVADFGPLIEAMNSQSEAMRSQPAPVVNVSTPAVTVEAPQITVEAPTINVAQPAITVEQPQVNVSTPPVNVTVQRGGEVQFETNEAGDITGATLT
jgi:hypothetical protein